MSDVKLISFALVALFLVFAIAHGTVSIANRDIQEHPCAEVGACPTIENGLFGDQ